VRVVCGFDVEIRVIPRGVPDMAAHYAGTSPIERLLQTPSSNRSS
jgi:hypothetical protein